MMTSCDLSSIESCLKLWRERIVHSKKKELSPTEICSYFQNPVIKILSSLFNLLILKFLMKNLSLKDLQQAFFRFLGRDENGSISMEEWAGCFSKLVG